MGARGRPPTPTPILKARGSRWATRGREGEPVPVAERPDCPDALQGEARREWNRQADGLEQMGILTLVDRTALTTWCLLWAEWSALAKRIQETRLAADGKTKVPMFPVGSDDWLKLAKARRETTDQLIRLAGQLGFSPSARTRIRVGDSKQQPAAEGKGRFFKGA